MLCRERHPAPGNLDISRHLRGNIESMKTITVGELRQNPSAMIADVEAGEVYELTRHQRRVGYIVPATSSATITPRRLPGPARTQGIPRHTLRSATSIEELLAEDREDR